MPDGICPTGECNVVDDSSSLIESSGDGAKTPQTASDEQRRSSSSTEDRSPSDDQAETAMTMPLEQDEARSEQAIADLDELLVQAGANN